MLNARFPGFCQFRMEKKEFAVVTKTLYDFPYFLMHIRPFDLISNYNKTNPGIYSWVPNKRPHSFVNFYFFSNSTNAYLQPSRLFIIQNIFLLTCTEIDDLNTNIPISKFQ